MTNLTEKWKKRELPNGEYWCLSVCGDIDKLYCYQNSFWKYKTEDDYYGVPVEIKQVLAPVPSYDEYEDLKSKLQLKETAYDFDTARLEEENTKLKELLKECVELMGNGTTYMYIDVYMRRKKDVMNAISQVLGEE